MWNSDHTSKEALSEFTDCLSGRVRRKKESFLSNWENRTTIAEKGTVVVGLLLL